MKRTKKDYKEKDEKNVGLYTDIIRGIREIKDLNLKSVVLKEANETFYWLSLLRDTDYLSEQIYKSISIDCKELIALLVSIVKSVKSSLGR